MKNCIRLPETTYEYSYKYRFKHLYPLKWYIDALVINRLVDATVGYSQSPTLFHYIHAQIDNDG